MTPDHDLRDGDCDHRAAEMASLLTTDVVAVAVGERDDVVEANDAFLRIVGRTREDLVGGLPWHALSPADQTERDAGAWAELERSGTSLVLQELQRPDGERVPVLVASIAVAGTDRWVVVVLDVGSEDSLARLAESEGAMVSALLDEAPVGFALLDTELRFVRVNREIAAMNGFTVEEHLGRHAFDMLPDLRETAEPLLRRVLETGEPLRDAVITGTTPADETTVRTWLESFFPVRTPHGSVLGVAAIARDETAVRALQAELADRAERQRQVLEQLQTSLLPALPLVADLDLAARYLSAADEVRLGGDWYDAVQGPDGRLLLAVGDAVGHGTQAVGLMARASAAVRAFVSEGHPPAIVLARLDALLATLEQEGFASAVLVMLDPATGELDYASAGHPYALLQAPDGTVERLVSAQGPLLGTGMATRYVAATATLEPGGSLLLYTDGLVERRQESLTRGLRRLQDALTALPPQPTARDLVEGVLAACNADGPREDDICVLAVTRPVAARAPRPAARRR